MHAKIRLTAVVQASVNNLALTLGLYNKCVTLIFLFPFELGNDKLIDNTAQVRSTKNQRAGFP